MEKMTVFKNLCVLCAKMGEEVEKLGRVAWTGCGKAGKVTQAACHVTIRGSAGKMPSVTIWQDLVTRAQSGQLSLTLETAAGSWPQSLLSPRGGRHSLSWDTDDVSLILYNMETGRKLGRAQERREKENKEKEYGLTKPIYSVKLKIDFAH